MSFWTWSPQNNSQLNPEKLKTFKETTDVVTFYSYFFSDITDLYDKTQIHEEENSKGCYTIIRNYKIKF